MADYVRSYRARRRSRLPVRYVDSDGAAWWFPARVRTKAVLPLLEWVPQLLHQAVPFSRAVEIVRALTPADGVTAREAWEREAPLRADADVPVVDGYSDGPTVLDELDPIDVQELAVALWAAYILNHVPDTDPDPDDDEGEDDEGPPVDAPDSST